MSSQLCLLGAPRRGGADGSGVLPFNKPSSLLFYLACRDTWVSRSELAFLYRPDEPDVEALAYLRKLVFRARQYAWASELELQDTRLRWCVDSDVRRFRQAADAQAWPEALEHYGGTFLEGLTLPDVPGYEAWLELERESLEAMWRRAATAHAEALEQEGRCEEAGVWLHRVLERDPLDEDSLQAYLRVLHADGKRHRALEVYNVFRRTLKHELDAEPLETTQTLVDSIRRGAGVLALAKASPPVEVHHNLPAPTTRFIGRKRELEHLARCLARPDCRLVTLLGLGGIGKTRLALECATQRVSAFPDGVWFVPLAGVNSAALLAPTIAGVLGLTLADASAPETQLADHLREKVLLLLLDNFEQLATGALLLEMLLEAAPKLKVLVTSRVALELRGEWLIDVGGLSYPPAETKEPLENFEAVRLFINRAERLSASFAATGATLEAIANLCRKVEGMPLALELAATWTRSLGVPDLVKSLERSFDLFATTQQDLPDRHRNLRAVLDYTWRNLGEGEQGVLSRLSVFRGGFTLEAAEGVAQAHLGLLLRFINHALVRHNRAGRYDMHELVRHHLSERLSEEAKAHTLEAFCGFFALCLAEQERTLKDGDEKAALNELDADVDNLRLAWRWSAKGGRLTHLRQMAECYYLLLDTRGWYQEGADAFQAAVHHVEALDEDAQQQETLGQLLTRAGYFQFRLGHLQAAKHLLEKSLQLLQSASAPAAEGFAHHYLGVLAFLAGDNHGAQRRYHQALACYGRANDGWSMTRTHNNLGVVADTLGDYDEALRWYHLALEFSRGVGHLRGVASAMVNLGVTFETLGQLAEAEKHYQESLEIYREVGDIRGEAASLTNLGHIAERRKAYPKARDYYEQSVNIKRTLGDPVVTAISLTNLGDTLLALGETQQALDAFAEALTLTQKAEAFPYALRVIWSYAKFHARHEDWSSALSLASFLTHCPEGEVWVQEEACQALETWGAEVSAKQLAAIRGRIRNVSFEQICRDLKPTG